MPSRKTKPDFHLTEMILAIHHEVQSAIDYISDVASKQSTELGQSSVVMGIDQLRLKLPINIALDQKDKRIDPPLESRSVEEIVRKLPLRKGFVIDRGAANKMGLFTKIKVNPLEPPEGGASDEPDVAPAELEISFKPMKRD